MGDLYFDDIEDRSYTDEMILADVEALVKSGQREGGVIDYKSDVSDKDNWPQTVAAFANSFGGVLIFGVEGKNDQPRRVTGFDPKGVEVKTKLASMVIDRIQPRPDFSLRVVTLDKNAGKEVAILRVAEGRRPPYMHSKDREHRVYVRVGAQKAEADYLQLSSLFERREKSLSQAGDSLEQAFGSDSQFIVPRPVSSNQISPYFFQFVASPRNNAVSLFLNREAENRFVQCINDIRGVRGGTPIRSRSATVFPVSGDGYQEQRFGLSAKGAVGFISYPGIQTERGLMFVPEHFCGYLLEFLSISSIFYERAARFYGPYRLQVTMSISCGADIFDAPPQRGNRIAGGAYLFEPPLNHISRHVQTELEASMHPALASRLLEYIETVLTDIARPHGSVLSADFQESMKGEANNAASRLVSARSR
jgi:hypothetical protein